MNISGKKIKMILKSGGIALLWVLIITYTTFPGLFSNTASFLSEQISFENTGKYLLFGIGIYIFDLWVQIIYFADKQVKKNLLIAGSLCCAALCVLIVPLAIDVEMNRISPILMVGISMSWLKSVSLYLNEGIVPRNTYI